jgi:hypothetical protein
VGGVAKHAMEHYFDFVSDGLDLTPVITHRFPLGRWDQAVLALKRLAAHRRRQGAARARSPRFPGPGSARRQFRGGSGSGRDRFGAVGMTVLAR